MQIHNREGQHKYRDVESHRTAEESKKVESFQHNEHISTLEEIVI